MLPPPPQELTPPPQVHAPTISLKFMKLTTLAFLTWFFSLFFFGEGGAPPCLPLGRPCHCPRFCGHVLEKFETSWKKLTTQVVLRIFFSAISHEKHVNFLTFFLGGGMPVGHCLTCILNREHVYYTENQGSMLALQLKIIYSVYFLNFVILPYGTALHSPAK